MALDEAVESIRSAAQRHAVPRGKGRKRSLWDTVLAQIAERDSFEGEFADTFLELIREFLAGRSDDLKTKNKMIAQELRIGNLAFNDKCIVKISGLYSHQCQIITKQGNEIIARLELLQSIPLSEEWLLKAGFEKSILQTWYKDELSLGFDGVYYMTDKPKVTISTVHKLQNVYFDIHDKELTFKI